MLRSTLTSFEVFGNLAPTAFATIGWRYFIVFITIPTCGLPIIWYYFPETKGITLEEIAGLFDEAVALELTHISPEQREELDAKIATMQIEGIAEGETQHPAERPLSATKH
jgi:hypothetical protein